MFCGMRGRKKKAEILSGGEVVGQNRFEHRGERESVCVFGERERERVCVFVCV